MSRWRIALVGDLSTAWVEGRTAYSASLAAAVSACDIRVANLEAPICGVGQAAAKSGPAIRMSESTADPLFSIPWSVVGLANNHFLDFGRRGAEETLASLKARGVRWQGVGLDGASPFAPEVVETSGVRVALLCAAERELAVDTADGVVVADVHSAAFDAAIRAAKESADLVVCFVHGGCEISFVPPVHWRNRLRQLTELGADIVVGHHPHVVQGVEEYGHALIAYSLGDFHWPVPQGRAVPERSVGGWLEVSFEGHQRVSWTFHLTRLDEGVTTPLAAHHDANGAVLQETLSTLVTDDQAHAEAWAWTAKGHFARHYAPRLLLSSPGASGRDQVRRAAIALLGGLHASPGRVASMLESQRRWTQNLLVSPSHRELCLAALASDSVTAGKPPTLAAVSAALHRITERPR